MMGIHRKIPARVFEQIVMQAVLSTVMVIMIVLSAVVIDAEARTYVTGRKWYVTVVNGESVDNYALYVRGRWEPVDRLSYVRCQLRDEFPECVR